MRRRGLFQQPPYQSGSIPTPAPPCAGRTRRTRGRPPPRALRPVAQVGDEVFARVDLALVAVERLYLQVERIGDVHPGVGAANRLEPGFPGMMRLQALRQKFGKIVLVSHGRIEGVENRLRDGAVIAVVAVEAVEGVVRRVVGDHEVRPAFPHHVHEVAPELRGVPDFPVRMAQEINLLHAHDRRRRALFALADRPLVVDGQPARFGAVHALVPARGEAILHAPALAGPPGDRTGAAELDVVGVGADDEDFLVLHRGFPLCSCGMATYSRG